MTDYRKDRPRLVRTLRGYGKFPSRDIADDFLDSAQMLEDDARQLSALSRRVLSLANHGAKCSCSECLQCRSALNDTENVGQESAVGSFQSLADRCEAAAGPDQDIDQAIRTAMNYTYAVGSVPPFYTSSLSDAMRLVDDRALWAVGNMEDGPFARICWPQPDGGYVGGYVEAKAATATLALCAAALRARASY